MSIQQSKKQSDLEKRLQLLRRQVYGKSPEAHYTNNQKLTTFAVPTHQSTNTMYKSGGIQISSDLNYLHQDLLKILIFASFAIGGQAILFLLVKNNVFTLNFF